MIWLVDLPPENFLLKFVLFFFYNVSKWLKHHKHRDITLIDICCTLKMLSTLKDVTAKHLCRISKTQMNNHKTDFFLINCCCFLWLLLTSI